MDTYVPREEPSSGPTAAYNTCSKGELLNQDKVNTKVKLPTTYVYFQFWEETIEQKFAVGLNEQKKRINSLIRNMMEEALIACRKCSVDTILVHSVDRCSLSTCFRDILIWRVVGSTAIIKPIVSFVKYYVEIMIGQVQFENAWLPQLTTWRIVPI